MSDEKYNILFVHSNIVIRLLREETFIVNIECIFFSNIKLYYELMFALLHLHSVRDYLEKYRPTELFCF